MNDERLKDTFIDFVKKYREALQILQEAVEDLKIISDEINLKKTDSDCEKGSDSCVK